MQDKKNWGQEHATTASDEDKKRTAKHETGELTEIRNIIHHRKVFFIEKLEICAKLQKAFDKFMIMGKSRTETPEEHGKEPT